MGFFHVFLNSTIGTNLRKTYIIKKNCIKTLGCCCRDNMLKIDFLEKTLGIISAPHFMYDFSRNMFLVLYSIK